MAQCRAPEKYSRSYSSVTRLQQDPCQVFLCFDLRSRQATQFLELSVAIIATGHSACEKAFVMHRSLT